ncbi:hypothetical protein LXL04_020509 [Taraxacum kok-saghyz]
MVAIARYIQSDDYASRVWIDANIRILSDLLIYNPVFDRAPPDWKKQELAKRYSRREDATTDLDEAIKVKRQRNEDCKKLLRLMTVRVIEVHVLAYKYILTFGAPKFLRHLMDPTSRKIPLMDDVVSKVILLSGLGGTETIQWISLLIFVF